MNEKDKKEILGLKKFINSLSLPLGMAVKLDNTLDDKLKAALLIFIATVNASMVDIKEIVDEVPEEKGAIVLFIWVKN